MTHASKASIRGLGFHVPPKVLTNADLERMVETNDEWIRARTGIRERHVADRGTTTSDLALEAAQSALADAGLAPEELTHVICATITPDSYTPASACLLQHKLGIKGKTAMDLNAACSGFLYSMEMARALVALHPEARVLVAAAEVLSSRVNWTDRTTCVLFGDGAGAAVVTAPEPEAHGFEIEDVLLSSDGALGELLTINGGGSGTPYALGDTVGEDFFVQMQGRDVFKHATRAMESVAREILDRNGLDLSDVDVLLPHQANVRIIEHVGKKLDFPPERVFVNVDRYGNTSAASVPIALTEARDSDFVKPGQRVLVATFGGGFTWGAGLLRRTG